MKKNLCRLINLNIQSNMVICIYLQSNGNEILSSQVLSCQPLASVCVFVWERGGVYKYDKDMKFKWVFIYKS